MQSIDIKGTILVVDDDVCNIEIIKSVLQSEYKILEAQDGKQALEVINKSLPDFVLLDWEMPVLNGLETLRHLKANPKTRSLPVIMMTGYMTDTNRLLEAYQNGVIDFIRKPFDLMELKARANSIFQLSDFYKKELRLKEHELLSYTLRLAELDRMLNEAVSKISDIHDEKGALKPFLREIKSLMAFNINKGIWSKFDEQFLNLHPHFVQNLLKAHPALTNAEIKLASLLRLNLSSKDLAEVLNQTYESIKVSRTRLRKKLGLETEDSIVTYLMQF